MLSQEAILALAPDPASVKAGQGLAVPGKWVEHGANDAAAWGLCQGSGKTPYRTQIDLAGPAFKCSCPSRKFPCKHAIGLMLLLAKGGDRSDAAPDWVREWLESRGEKQANVAKKAAATPYDPAKESTKRAKRLATTAQQLPELRRWMEDLVAGGLASLAGEGYGVFDEQARRMVDAKAPGIARLLSDLAGSVGSGKDWDRRAAEQLGRIMLLIDAVEKADALPEPLRRDVEAAVGIPVPAAELAALSPWPTPMQCFAQTTEVEDNLRMQRSWLIGEDGAGVGVAITQVMHYAHGATAMDARLLVGRSYADLRPHPGSGWRSGLPAGDVTHEPVKAWHTLESFTALLDRWASLLAANPWAERLCAPVREVRLVTTDAVTYLVDANGAAVPLTTGDEERWQLLVGTGGAAANVAVEVSLTGFRCLGVLPPASAQAKEAA